MPRDTFDSICVLCTRAAKPNGYCDPHDRQYGPASTAGAPPRPRTMLKPPKGGDRAQRVRAGAAGLAAMKAQREAAKASAAPAEEQQEKPFVAPPVELTPAGPQYVMALATEGAG